MYAVVKTGGRQYKVQASDILAVEKLNGKAGEKVALEDVLLFNDGKKSTVGAPRVEGAKVTAEILDQQKADKILVFKKKRRHNYRRTKGHRQQQTLLYITELAFGGATAKADGKKPAVKQSDAKAESKTTAKKETAKKATDKKPAAKKAPAKKPATKKTTTKKDS